MKNSIGGSLEYIYDAAGNKLAKKLNGAFVNFYCGSVVYTGSKAVEYVMHSQGMARPNGSNWDYQYNVTDHLGNVRSVASASNAVLQSTDYFPFGLAHSTTPTGLAKNKYLYNGKELQTELGFGWYDYHARMYDPSKGIFGQVDPMTEKYFGLSPYVYCSNNPLKYIDRNGMEFDDENERKAIKLERKIENRIIKLERRINRMERNGEDIGDLAERVTQLRQSIVDISDMRNHRGVNYQYINVNDRSNPAGRGNPTIEGVGTNDIKMYVGKDVGIQLHESRHGGDVARGALTIETYGVNDEITAYQAQYAYSGNFSYIPANALDNAAVRSAWGIIGMAAVIPVSINNTQQINANMVNNIGTVTTGPRGQMPLHPVPLYPPLGIGRQHWNNN